MKTILLLSFLFSLVASADTPPSGVVKAKTFTGDGVTGITATGTSLNVNVTNSSTGTVTANQGTAGGDPWLFALPNNACQESGGHLASIDSKLTAPLAVSGTFWQATQPVSAASLPLPTGAATAAKQPALGTAGSASSDVITVQGIASMTAFKVDGSAVTQPVSGTFWQATQPVSVASLPLPSGGSTAALQTSGNSSLTSIDGKIPSNLTVTSTRLLVDGSGVTQPISASALPLPTGASTEATLSTLNGKVPSNLTVTSTRLLVDGSGVTQPVSAASLPLPSGAATAAKQPALGTAGSASSDVITVQGVTSMTALKVDGSAVTQPVSGTVTANAGTGTFTVDASGHTVPISAASLPLPTGAATAAKQPALGTAGSASSDVITVQGIASMTAFKVDGSAVTQPVSGTFWQATQPVSGTFFQTTQPVSGTFWQATQPVSIATAPVLVAGSAIIGKVGIDQTTPGTTNLVALSANQSVNVAQINGVTPLMGNGTTGTGSQRVTIASDNTAFSVNAIPKTPTAVTVKQAAVTIGTSAVRLTNDGLVPPSTRVLLVAQLLSTSTANCYFGSSGVTSTSTGRGVQMFAGQTFSFANDAGDYYAICDGASQTFFITEQE